MKRERVLCLERECEQIVEQAFEGIDHRWSGRGPVDRVALEPVILAGDELIEGNRAGVGLIWLRQGGSVRLLRRLVIRLRFRSKEP